MTPRPLSPLRRLLRHATQRAPEERFLAICDSLNVGIFEVDPQGNCLYANPTSLAILGLTADQAAGSGWRASIAADDHSKLERIGSEGFNGQVRMKALDRDLWIRMYPVLRGAPEAFESHAAMVGTLTDVTERRRQERELLEARDAAEAANRSKEEFLARVSHDMRMPMHGIIGTTELVLATQLSSDQRDYIETAKSSAENLVRVLNDLQDFSKMESGKLDIESVPFDLDRTIQFTLQTLSFKIHEKDLELTSSIAPGTPSRLMGDPARIRQILNNLLDNAVKFTDAGFIGLEVNLEAKDDSSVTLRFTVRDSGRGMSADTQETILGPYRQLGGTGLGLAICQGLVKAMGGRLWIESSMNEGSINHGTAVHFTLDLNRCGEQQGSRILLVEEHPIDRRILAHALSGAGFDVVSAATPQDALQAAEAAEIPFDLLIASDHSPSMDGVELIGQLRRLPMANPELPFLMCCLEIPRNRDDFYRAGVKAWIQKPLNREEIIREAEALLGFQPGGSRSSTKAKSRKAARILVADHSPVDQTVAKRLLEGQGHEVTIVGDGPTAYDRIDRDAFDLCLMDMHLPLIDGLDLTRQIRRLESSVAGRRHMPIIALTANAMTSDRVKCLEAGMDDYLSKPVSRDDLVRTLERWLAAEREMVPVA